MHGSESSWGDGIAFEELWHVYLETITSKAVGEEPSVAYRQDKQVWGKGGTTCKVIRKLEAEDICQVERRLVLRIFCFGRAMYVCLDAIHPLIFPLGRGGVGVSKHKKDKMKILLSAVSISSPSTSIRAHDDPTIHSPSAKPEQCTPSWSRG